MEVPLYFFEGGGVVVFVDIVFDEEQNLFLSFCQHGIVDFRFIFEIDLTFESFSIIVQPRCSGQGKNCFCLANFGNPGGTCGKLSCFKR